MTDAAPCTVSKVQGFLLGEQEGAMRQAVWRGGAVLGLLLTTGSPVRADDSSGLDVVDHLPVANVVVRTGLGLLGANESSRTYTAFRQTDDVTSVGPQTDRDSALFAGD